MCGSCLPDFRLDSDGSLAPQTQVEIAATSGFTVLTAAARATERGELVA
ncbi:MAG: hypothetical protein AAGG99_03295 [Pseudomonadota bacterium]